MMIELQVMRTVAELLFCNVSYSDVAVGVNIELNFLCFWLCLKTRPIHTSFIPDDA